MQVESLNNLYRKTLLDQASRSRCTSDLTTSQLKQTMIEKGFDTSYIDELTHNSMLLMISLEKVRFRNISIFSFEPDSVELRLCMKKWPECIFYIIDKANKMYSYNALQYFCLLVPRVTYMIAKKYYENKYS